MKILSWPHILTFAALLFTSSCNTKNTMQGVMSSWVGSDISSVIAKWGHPNEVKIINGKKSFVWHYEKEATIPQRSLVTTGHVNPKTGSFQSVTTPSIITTLHGYCTRILEVDESNVVQFWKWQGNNCPFAEWMEYRKWRNKSPSASNLEVTHD